MKERTFTIIKPEAVEAGLSGRIIDRLIGEGFRLLALKLVCLSRNEAEKFYADHRDKPFFGELVAYMSAGPIVAAVLEREDAVAALRRTVGATDPAKAEPGTIRRLYGTDLQHNAIHASDSMENARAEAAQLFTEKEIVIARYRPC